MTHLAMKNASTEWLKINQKCLIFKHFPKTTKKGILLASLAKTQNETFLKIFTDCGQRKMQKLKGMERMWHFCSFTNDRKLPFWLILTFIGLYVLKSKESHFVERHDTKKCVRAKRVEINFIYFRQLWILKLSFRGKVFKMYQMEHFTKARFARAWGYSLTFICALLRSL